MAVSQRVHEQWESETHLNAHLAGIAMSAPPMPEVRSVELVRYQISGFGPLQG
uniref:hypothetical protein n=1 Tax=Paractinoplanes polyasparticus TaxID=2856853 RepID=UPI001C85DC6A|nr:hypothetical protein [Actinoplanes polyasparticus]